MVSPENDVLAFILSTRFAAANLNRNCGPMQSITYIDRFGDDILVGLDEMIAFTQSVLCDPRSANTGPNGDQAWRAVIQNCLMEWDGMNSDGDDVFAKDRRTPPFHTPY